MSLAEFDRPPYALGQYQGAFEVGFRGDDHELFAANPADGIDGAHGVDESLTEPDQDVVAAGQEETRVDRS